MTGPTLRKVSRETGGGTGTESERLRLTLGVRVEDVDYDADAMQIRLKGRNETESEHVKLGAYHTLEVEPHRAVSIEKDQWDASDLARVKEACDPAASADLACLLIGEGMANLLLVGGAVTAQRARVEQSLPKKRGAALAAGGYDKAVAKFFDKCLGAVERGIDWGVVKCLVVAGPGFTKDAFLKHLDKEIVRQDKRVLIENRKRIVTAHASSPFKHSLKEVLADPTVAARIKDTKVIAPSLPP